jgi:hypothetical protein
MLIKFSNSETVSFKLDNNPVAEIYKKIYKHLQHIDIPFRPWDNPFYTHDVQHLLDAAEALNVSIDHTQLNSQLYLNHLHQVYESSYNGDTTWLDFHEQIHLLEPRHQNFNKLLINYREKSGLLMRSFDHTWLEHSVTKIEPGDVYVTWAELGKIPYRYWDDREPNDIDRICELCKPWLTLRPQINVALEEYNLMSNIDSQSFLKWWDQYQQRWCSHWNLNSWTLHNMFGVIPVGKMSAVETDRLIQLLRNCQPVRVII